MEYELIKFELTEETKTHYMFTIHMRFTPNWFVHILGKQPYTEVIPCSRSKSHPQSQFISNGDRLFYRFLSLDYVIDSILSTESKYFEKQL